MLTTVSMVVVVSVITAWGFLDDRGNFERVLC